jgi:ferredoxin
MSVRVDTSLLGEIEEYGAVNVQACFNCGNCTAICPLTSSGHPFPRNVIRMLQMGMRDRLLQSTDPWQCYYCGECTQTCPRQAEPAETMMAARRWLTAQYDRSGHGAKLYTSEKTVALTILKLSLITLGLFVGYHALTGFGNIPAEHTSLNSFAPVMLVWALVLIHFAMLGARAAANIVRMARLVLGTDLENGKLPLSVYIQELPTLITHFFTQRRWRDCGEDHSRWWKHLLMASGYLTMLLLVVALLGWFQTDNLYPIYHPQRWLGYYATIVLLYGSVEALIGRYRRKEEVHRYSHPTDWLFPTFILVGAVTGILVHIFRYLNWPYPTYGMYLVHVMAMVAMLDTEVGIGKWTHLLYRPLALYLAGVKERASQLGTAPGMAAAD